LAQLDEFCKVDRQISGIEFKQIKFLPISALFGPNMRFLVRDYALLTILGFKKCFKLAKRYF